MTQPNPAPAQGQQPTPPQPGQAPASGQPQYPQQPQGQPGQVPAPPAGQPSTGQPPAPPAWPQPYPGQVPGPYGQPAYPPPYPPQPGQVPGQQPPTQPQQGLPGQVPAPSWQPPTPPTPGPPAGQAPAGQPGTGQGDDPGGDGGRDISGLPQWAQQQITALRKENADRRVAARTATVGQHAYQVATQAGVNPAALLGSTAWQQAAAQLDPTAADYAQRLTWTVQSLLAANPWMAAPAQPGQPGPPPPPAQSGGDFGGGTGAGTPITEQQLAQMTPEEISKAFDEGKLKHLL